MVDFFRHFKSFQLHWRVIPGGSNWKKSVFVQWMFFSPNRRQAITCTNGDPVHWRKYASPGLTEFIDDSSWLATVYQHASTTLTCWVSNDASIEYKAITLKVIMMKLLSNTHVLWGNNNSPLTHLPLDKMAAISQTILSGATCRERN